MTSSLSESAVRRRLRWHEAANTLAILFFVALIVALAAFVIARSSVWQRAPRSESSPPPVAAAKPPVRPSAPAKAPAPAVSPALAPAMPKPAEPQASESKTPKPVREAPAPAPRIRIGPPVPAVEDELAVSGPTAMDRPSGPAAKQMLHSIKCFDEFLYDRQAGARHYFSALCKGGNRMQVSCVGSGCRIEYAPPPSHAPTGG